MHELTEKILPNVLENGFVDKAIIGWLNEKASELYSGKSSNTEVDWTKIVQTLGIEIKEESLEDKLCNCDKSKSPYELVYKEFAEIAKQHFKEHREELDD